MDETNLEYYERRAREEAELAASSFGAETSSAHRLLAIDYEAHARELRSDQKTRLKLNLQSN